MLDTSVRAIKDKLNTFLSRHYDFDDDPVVIAPLFDQSDAVGHSKNKLSVFVVNLQKDTTSRINNQFVPASGNTMYKTTPPLFLNMYIMIGAYFDPSRYQQSLQLLSSAILCFQEQPVLDRYNTPELPDGLDKLILDIENIGIRELSNLWGMLGGRYFPSILYRVRMIGISSDAIQSRESLASSPETSSRNKN